MADNTNLICPLCSLNISDDVEFQVIGKSGVTTFIDNGIQCEVGQRVHRDCRKRYSKPLKFKKHDIESTPLPRLRRKTDEPAFNLKTCAFYVERLLYLTLTIAYFYDHLIVSIGLKKWRKKGMMNGEILSLKELIM